LERLKELEKLRDRGVLELPPEVESAIQVQNHRNKNKEQIEAATGLKFDVVTKGLDPHVAAFVRTDNKKTFINEKTLDDQEFAMYAANHEAEHVKNSIFKMDLKEELKPDEYDILSEEMGENGVADLAKVDWVEGFNDLITADKHGKNSRSGYQEKEVPAAQKLDQLSKQMIGKSLKEAFENGDRGEFVQRLKLLCAMLKFKGMVGKVMSNAIN
jgi:hypothetical protein